MAVCCRLFAVSRAGFYDWVGRHRRSVSKRTRLKIAIRAAHIRTRETYGARRLQPELARDGFAAGRDRIARLRREMGLGCRQKRKFKATTNSAHSLPVADNVLDQVFEPTRPNEAWTGDITYSAPNDATPRAPPPERHPSPRAINPSLARGESAGPSFKTKDEASGRLFHQSFHGLVFVD